MTITINVLYLAQLLCAGWVAQSIFFTGLSLYSGQGHTINRALIIIDIIVFGCLVYLLLL